MLRPPVAQDIVGVGGAKYVEKVYSLMVTEALMTRQLLAVFIVTVSIVAAVAVRPEAGQTNGPAPRVASTAKPYVPPKTPWGDPDIQGGYSNKDENGIPFERPGNLAGKQLGEIDDSELAELAEARDKNRLEAARGIGGRETGAGPVALVRALRGEEQPRMDGDRSP